MLLARLGAHVRSTYHILFMMKKRSHTLSIALLLMACMCMDEIPSLESIHNKCRQNQYESFKGKSPKYLWLWLFPAAGTPKLIIDTFILALAETSANFGISIHSLEESSPFFLQFIRSKSKMARGI